MERGNVDKWSTPLLAGFSGEVGARLTTEPVRVRLAAGEWLFREGDPADCAYLVHSGRIEVVIEHPTEVVIRQIKRGAMIGELALLMHGVRPLSARASRDSEVTTLSRAQFEELVLGSPGFALGLLRAMATQIAANRAPSTTPSLPETIAVVPFDPAAPAARIGADLTKALAAYRRVDELRPDPERPEADFRALLKRTEVRNEQVVLSADSHAGSDPWTSFCLKEADVVVAVTTGAPSPEWLERAKVLRGCELIVVDAALDPELGAALAPREVQVVRGESALDACITSTARRLAGRAVGLVLSGGGARALAHLGVLQELERTGIAIDRFGGASMGAIVSALAARGAASGEIIELCQRMMLDSSPSNDYTVPAYGLIRGTKTRHALSQVFGELRIEELERRWFCVASDLVSRELVVHRTGPIADAVYSSMALPGVYPPIPTPDGRLLVDGGVMDNLPVATMGHRAEGPIIAVDVSQRLGMAPPPQRPRLERLTRRARRLMTGYELPLPPLRETIHWTIALGSNDTVAAGMRHADIVISPRVEGIGILDWKQLPRALEIGRQAAREALEAAGPKLDSWRR
ncbi:MAG TPA: patatin-like phospholipase family protein [Solirubrobacteraceae bacterium]